MSQARQQQQQQQQQTVSATSSSSCWECLRRDVSCDATHPACRVCIDKGLVCPGYENRKPLRWLVPGTVTARPRRKSKKKLAIRGTTVQGSHDGGTTSSGGQPGDRDQPSNELVLVKVRGEEKGSTEALVYTPVALHRTVLTLELDNMVQAIQYWNTVALSQYQAVSNLAASPWLAPIPLETLRLYPSPIIHTFVFMSLGYRICQFPEGADRAALRVLQTRMYDHRGKAIQIITSVLRDEALQTSDYALSIVLMLLFGESRQCASPTWTQHFEGASRMIDLRGGLKDLTFHPSLRDIIEYFLIIGVMANTMSPAPKQLAMTSQSSFVDTVARFYGDGLFPVLLCPPELFLEIIRINELRADACLALYPSSLPSPDLLASPPAQKFRSTAEALLQRLLAYDAQSWADAHKDASTDGRDHDAEWLLLGRIYQSAITLYCVSSLQSLEVLPRRGQSAPTRIRRDHRARLAADLKVALRSPEIKMWMMWPLVVVGLEVAEYDGSVVDLTQWKEEEELREFVDAELCIMARALGTPLPLFAREKLTEFRRRGGQGWDACFDGPFAFIT